MAGTHSAAPWLVLSALVWGLVACGAIEGEGERAGPIVFRCIDQSWFRATPSNRPNEIIISRPGLHQVRLQRTPSPDGGFSYRAGGYAMAGRGRDVRWIEENRLPIRCTAQADTSWLTNGR